MLMQLRDEVKDKVVKLENLIFYRKFTIKMNIIDCKLNKSEVYEFILIPFI